jgi:RNA polymerase-interacting CarD/CdnL/TRCF family regulator
MVQIEEHIVLPMHGIHMVAIPTQHTLSLNLTPTTM